MIVVKVLEDHDSDCVLVQFPYNGDTVAAFRNLPEAMIDRNKGYGWDRDTKLWCFPMESFSIAESVINETHEKGELYWRFIESEDDFS